MRTISLFKSLLKFIQRLLPVKNTADKEYKKLLRHVLKHGSVKKDRTGTGTISTFGYQMRFPLQEGFPLLTTKLVSFKLVAIELLWFISGSTNIKPLVLQNCNIWNKDAYRGYKEKLSKMNPEPTHLSFKDYIERIKSDEEFANEYGDLGHVYGKQWREWSTANGELIDQLQEVIHTIKNNPNSRRIIVSAWNVGDIPSMTLPPCHSLFQFYVQDGKLNCQLYQRSADIFLGVPFNIASYALLTHLIAHECGLEVGDFIHTLGDSHIYLNHVDQVKQQLKRKPFELPVLELNKEIDSVFKFTLDDMKVANYKHHSVIKGEMST